MNIQNKLVVLTITLISALSIAGCGKTEDKGPKPAVAPEAKTTVGTDIDDATITTKVKSALLKDKDTKSLDINVATNKGEVQLSGFADNEAHIDQAAEIARGVAGVKSIINELSIEKSSAVP